MIFTDNPDRDFAAYEHELRQRLAHLPVCDICGEVVQEEYYHRLFDRNVCDRCLNDSIKFMED